MGLKEQKLFHCAQYSLSTVSVTKKWLWTSTVTASHTEPRFCWSDLLWAWIRLKGTTEVAHLSTVNIYNVQTKFVTFSSSVWCQSLWLDGWTWEAVNAEGAVLLWNTYCTEQEKWSNPQDESEVSKINYCVGIWKWWLVKITNLN
jgi:hypothetical protein